MSIPLICQTATTQDAAARPSVAISATAVAAVLALGMAAEREAGVARSLEELADLRYMLDGTATAGHMVPAHPHEHSGGHPLLCRDGLCCHERRILALERLDRAVAPAVGQGL